MAPTSPSSVLVLGAQGMLGHTVYKYFKNIYPLTTFGTVRNKSINDKDLLIFDAFNPGNLIATLEKIKKIKYIINCIGVLPNNSTKDMKFINAKFPQKISLISASNKTKLIHISTDAVFSRASNKAYEDTISSPDDLYGKTKLQGEPNSTNTISIRTSLLGFDPLNHRGLLEEVMQEKNVKGFTNQLWSGCTTLQFAKLCENIINENKFDEIRKHTSILHFSPIKKRTKHDIINTFFKIKNIKKKIKKIKNKPTTRVLVSKYLKLLYPNQFKNDLDTALKELVLFENYK